MRNPAVTRRWRRNLDIPGGIKPSSLSFETRKFIGPHPISASRAVKVFVTTSDFYNPLLPGFAYLFNKHWSPEQEVTVLCYSEPDCALPDNFSLCSLGDPAEFGNNEAEWSKGRRGFQFHEPYPTPRWTDSLRPVFEALTDEHFILLQIDYFIHQPVELDTIERLSKYLSVPGVVRIDLFETRPCHQRYALDDGLEIVSIQPGGRRPWGQTSSEPELPYFKTSLQTAIWKRDFFLSLLKPGRDPWSFEERGMEELQDDDGVVLGVNQPGAGPVPYANVYRQGSLDLDEVRKIGPQSLSEMRALGLIGPEWIVQA
jgi:hypothetical protein